MANNEPVVLPELPKWDDPTPANFVVALKITEGVFDEYRQTHPKWWKRMDGTPILNDVAMLMAYALTDAVKADRATRKPTEDDRAAFETLTNERAEFEAWLATKRYDNHEYAEWARYGWLAARASMSEDAALWQFGVKAGWIDLWLADAIRRKVDAARSAK